MRGNPWWYSSSNIFYRDGYPLPNCTCYAYGRYAEIRGAFANLPGGPAGTWWERATDFEKGQTPALGAVACWYDPLHRFDGHVAIVEAIDEDGNITTSNSAYGGTYFYTAELTKDSNYQLSYHDYAYRFQGFIYNTVIPYVVNPHVIAAICGNFAIESNINPGLWESLVESTFDHEYEYDNIGGYGLGQWTNVGTSHGRLYKMAEWLRANGHVTDSGNGQLDYLFAEDYWTPNPNSELHYETLTDFINSDSTGIAGLVHDFMLCWEGISNGTLNQRVQWAVDCLNYYESHKDDPVEWTWIKGNRYLTTDEVLNNAMCVFKALTRGYPAEPITTKTPLWIYLPHWI